MKKLEAVLLGLVILFSLFIRLQGLGVPGFWVDESISAVASKNIITDGFLGFDSGVSYNRATVYHYTEAFFLLFGANEFNARLASVLFGVLAVVLAYFVGREFRAGLLSAFFVAVFYLDVFFSRQARFYQLFQLMFYLCLYLMYKSIKKKWLIYPSLLAFLVAVDTQIAGYILAPFIIVFVLYYRRKEWWLALVPLFVLIWKFVGVSGLADASSVGTSAGAYASLLGWYWLIPFAAGVYFFRKKMLSYFLIVPSVVLLVGVLFVSVIATRYVFFFSFVLMIFSAAAFSKIRFGWVGGIVLVVLASNIVVSMTYTTVLAPIDYNLYDPTAPETDINEIPASLVEEMRASVVGAYFSPPVEWYIKKPDFVLGFTMNGIGNDSISRDGVDVYSGAPMGLISPPFFFVAETWAVDKLTDSQEEELALISACELRFETEKVAVYECS